jgi:hypothetical protein
MKNRLLSIILIFLVAFSFASCGVEVKNAEPAGKHQESGLEDVSGSNKDNVPGDKTDKPAKVGDIDESELPEGFRTDLVPIFKGGVIVDAQEDAGMPEFIVHILSCYSDKPYAAVQEFYKEIMYFQCRRNLSLRDWRFIADYERNSCMGRQLFRFRRHDLFDANQAELATVAGR